MLQHTGCRAATTAHLVLDDSGEVADKGQVHAKDARHKLAALGLVEERRMHGGLKQQTPDVLKAQAGVAGKEQGRGGSWHGRARMLRPWQESQALQLPCHARSSQQQHRVRTGPLQACRLHSLCRERLCRGLKHEWCAAAARALVLKQASPQCPDKHRCISPGQDRAAAGVSAMHARAVAAAAWEAPRCRGLRSPAC